MIIEQSITFIIGNEGFPSWQLKHLKKLASFFRSIINIRNITTAKVINIEHALKVLSIGCKKNDLCQLRIEGSDAELTCMVLTDFISEHFDIVNTFHKYKEKNTLSIIEKHPTFHLPFSLNYSYERIPAHNELEKYALISKMSTALNKKMAHPIFKAMKQREDISSTGIGNNIAIPHLMIEGISTPAITIVRLDRAINWGSNLGNINLIIAMLIPASATLEVIRAFTKITRSLLDPIKCDFLTSTIEPEAIKAILFHIMAKENDPF